MVGESGSYFSYHYYQVKPDTYDIPYNSVVSYKIVSYKIVTYKKVTSLLFTK